MYSKAPEAEAEAKSALWMVDMRSPDPGTSLSDRDRRSNLSSKKRWMDAENAKFGLAEGRS